MKRDEKKCPRCAEIVKRDAKACKHCGYEFSEADERAAKAGSQQKKEKVAGCGCAIVLALAALAMLGKCGSDGGVNASSNSAQVAAADKAKAAEAAEDKRKGFHCLSDWDGSSSSFVAAVKDQLRDPDSFEVVDTRIAPVENGRHAIFMTYRAKNGFGGMNKAMAVGFLDHETCDATVTSVEVGD